MPSDIVPQPPALADTAAVSQQSAASPGALEATRPRPAISRDALAHVGDLVVLMLAVVGAIAFGLGISSYFTEHRHVAGYLIAYAGFRLALLLVRDHPGREADRLPSPQISNRLLLLLAFAAAPFERTYIYGGENPHWLAALGLLLELAGLWLALGARIQLAYFSSDPSGKPILVRSGCYRFIRHPTYTGIFLAFVAWSLEYGAPIVALLMVIGGTIVIRRAIAQEEAALLARFGDEYEGYMHQTDSVIPGVW